MTTKKKFIIEDNVLTQEWNWDKNNELGLNPNALTFFSGKKAWWKCKLNHEWESTIYHKAVRQQGCPYCANRRVLIGFNDLATTHSELLKEWSYKLNHDILPTQITCGSDKKVWWECELKHTFLMKITDKRKHGCPYCSNRKVLIGFNDLATTHPNLVREWNYYKNKDVLPTQIR